ncbi:MAG: hypothetical protein RLZZ165_568 [Bacteroidota bacterium]|jgi:hypothetical protein
MQEKFRCMLPAPGSMEDADPTQSSGAILEPQPSIPFCTLIRSSGVSTDWDSKFVSVT